MSVRSWIRYRFSFRLTAGNSIHRETGGKSVAGNSRSRTPWPGLITNLLEGLQVRELRLQASICLSPLKIHQRGHGKNSAERPQRSRSLVSDRVPGQVLLLRALWPARPSLTPRTTREYSGLRPASRQWRATRGLELGPSWRISDSSEPCKTAGVRRPARRPRPRRFR